MLLSGFAQVVTLGGVCIIRFIVRRKWAARSSPEKQSHLFPPPIESVCRLSDALLERPPVPFDPFSDVIITSPSTPVQQRKFIHTFVNATRPTVVVTILTERYIEYVIAGTGKSSPAARTPPSTARKLFFKSSLHREAVVHQQTTSE